MLNTVSTISVTGKWLQVLISWFLHRWVMGHVNGSWVNCGSLGHGSQAVTHLLLCRKPERATAYQSWQNFFNNNNNNNYDRSSNTSPCIACYSAHNLWPRATYMGVIK